MNTAVGRSKDPCYRVTLVGQAWRLLRPRASVPQAFHKLDDALASISADSGNSPATVEILTGATYMVKHLDPCR